MTKTVLITGCSTGFGKLAAKTFSVKGWNVVATMRSPEKETELTHSDNLILAKLDVTDEKSINDAIALTLEKFGSIDVLVNNAGYGGQGLFEQTSEEDIRKMYDTNVYGPMKTMRAVLPLMREQGHGTIINVTSVGGHFGVPHMGVYSSTKHALVGFTEAMALEYKPLGIKFYNVAPGSYPTTAFNDNTDKRAEQGDAQLVEYSSKLNAQIEAVAAQMANQSGSPSDPQEVADKIYACATSDMPVHNPTGADAEMVMAMMKQDTRQDVIDQMTGMLIPQ